MNDNYIEFFIDSDERPTVIIHKNGRSRTIKNRDNIRKLLSICEKYGYKITEECIIKDRVLLIAHDYEEYANKKKNLKVVGEINQDMKVSRKSKVGKIAISALALATITTLAFTDISKSKVDTSPNNFVKGIEATTEEDVDNDLIELSPSQTMVFSDEVKAKPKDSYELQEGEDIVEQLEAEDVTVNIIGDAALNVVDSKVEEKEELSSMFTPVEFHYECDEEADKNAMDNAMRYDDIFERFANDYGVDKGLLEARAAQETNGNHEIYLEGYPAIGLMQIERANIKTFDDGTQSSISAYNFRTGQVDKVYFTEENMKDLETNIQIAAMMTQDALKNNNYNILVGTQEYNMGCGNMGKIMNMCSDIEGIDTKDLRNNLDRTEWLQYRAFLGVGDPKYIEHNFRYLPNGYTIKIKRVDTGEYETLTIYNDYQLNIQK